MRDEEKDIDVNIKVGSMFRRCNKCLKLELELEHLSIFRSTKCQVKKWRYTEKLYDNNCFLKNVY